MGGPNDPPELVDPNYFRSYAALATLTTAGVLYYSYHNVSIDTIPVTERRRLRFIGSKLSSIISNTSVNSLLEQYKAQGILIEDETKHSGLQQIREIGDQLSLANNLPKQKYYLVNDNQPNAFVIQGHVFVTTSILPVLKNKDGAAIVLGHEMGHVLADHMAERLGLLAILGGFFMFLKLFGGVLGGDLSFLIGRSVVDLPRSRKMESEADYIGLYLAAKACYNLNEAPLVFERMDKATNIKKEEKENKEKKVEGSEEKKEEKSKSMQVNVDELFSTHPSFERRIGLINRWLKEDKLIQAAAGCQKNRRSSRWSISLW